MSTLGQRMNASTFVEIGDDVEIRDIRTAEDVAYARAWRRWLKDENLMSQEQATKEQLSKLHEYVDEERKFIGDR